MNHITPRDVGALCRITAPGPWYGRRGLLQAISAASASVALIDPDQRGSTATVALDSVKLLRPKI